MAIRTTGAKVKLIFDTTMTAVELDPFIEVANIVVDDQISTATSTKLEAIERWLAAHFACVWDRRSIDEKAGSVSVSYMPQQGKRLDNTDYGQNAILLDDTGALAALNALSKKKQTGTMSTLHKEPSSW
jgi:hypothetical protein